MPSSKSPIKAVAEIVINVEDIGRAQTFYENVLGFSHHSHFPKDEPTIVFLTIAEVDSPLGNNGHPQLFALIDPHRHPPARKRFRGLDVARSTLNHLAFEIDPGDYESEKARLESEGLAVQEQTFPHMNAKALFFRDLDGNTLEFICNDSG